MKTLRQACSAPRLPVALTLCLLVALVGGLAGNVHAQLIPGVGAGLSADTGTVALFHFEDSAATALDSAGFTRNAAVTNTTSGAGLFGSGRIFNGTTDRLEFADVFSALNGASAWSIEYFAKSDDGIHAPMLTNHNASAGWYLNPGLSSISYGVKTAGLGSNWYVLTSVATPPLDTNWHYYAMTWTLNGSLNVYRDGVLLATTGVIVGAWAGSYSYGAFMGYDPWSGAYLGAGVVDDLRFSSVARSAAEIQAAYSIAAIPEPSGFVGLAGCATLLFVTWWKNRLRSIAAIPPFGTE